MLAIALEIVDKSIIKTKNLPQECSCEASSKPLESHQRLSEIHHECGQTKLYWVSCMLQMLPMYSGMCKRSVGMSSSPRTQWLSAQNYMRSLNIKLYLLLQYILYKTVLM